MSRFDVCTLGAITIAIVMTGCGSSDFSTSKFENASPAVGMSKKLLSVESPVSGPPHMGSPAELGAAPPEASIEADAAKAALADRNVRAKLRDIALQVSSSVGVAQPTSMHVVSASDHQSAETLVSGAVINDHRPVYVITMAGGRFTASSHPYGAPAPQGDVLTVTVDAATNRVTDMGIDDVAADLSSLGPILDLNTP